MNNNNINNDNNINNNNINNNKEENKIIKEGLAIIENVDNKVFYNKAQVINRDITIIVIKAFAQMQKNEIKKTNSKKKKKQKNKSKNLNENQNENVNQLHPLQFAGFKILDCLAATGLRPIRYAKELKGIVNMCVANDIDFNAAKNMYRNIQQNEILDHEIIVTMMEGRKLMYNLCLSSKYGENSIKRISSLTAGCKIPLQFLTSCINTSNNINNLPYSFDLYKKNSSFFLSPLIHYSSSNFLPYLSDTCINAYINKEEKNNINDNNKNDASCLFANFLGLPCILIKKYITEEEEKKLFILHEKEGFDINLLLSPNSFSFTYDEEKEEKTKENEIEEKLIQEEENKTLDNMRYMNNEMVMNNEMIINEEEIKNNNENENKNENKKKIKNKLINIIEPLLFEIVDIDPFGSAAEFIDSAVQIVCSGGIICITSTDTTVLCGVYPEVSFYKYGGIAMKSRYCHEMSLRLLLHTVTMCASRYKRVAIPLLSFSVDFYVRIFVQIKDYAEGCKLIAQNTALVHQCVNCDSFHVVPFGRENEKKKKKINENIHSIKINNNNNIENNNIDNKNEVENINNNNEINNNMNEDMYYIMNNNNNNNENNINNEQNMNDVDINDYINLNENNNNNNININNNIINENNNNNIINENNNNNFLKHKFKIGRVPTHINNICDQCGGEFSIGGPFYSGPLHKPDFVDLCLSICEKASKESPGLTMTNKIHGILLAIKEEILDISLHYSLPSLCHRMKVDMIKPNKFKAALLNLGYNVSHFYRDPQSIKTNAPNNVVFDILRTHAVQTLSTDKIYSSPILQKPILTQNIDFTLNVKLYENKSNKKNLNVKKWLPNPEPFWGPKNAPENAKKKRKRFGGFNRRKRSKNR